MKEQYPTNVKTGGRIEWLTNQLHKYCSSKRMKYSEKRLMVAMKLVEIDRKVEAEELWILLKQDGYPISIASVYLNLSVLVDAGICVSERLSQRQALYCMSATA